MLALASFDLLVLCKNGNQVKTTNVEACKFIKPQNDLTLKLYDVAVDHELSSVVLTFLTLTGEEVVLRITDNNAKQFAYMLSTKTDFRMGADVEGTLTIHKE